MDDNERRRIESLTVEEFDRELVSRFGVKPRVTRQGTNLRDYDIDVDTLPSGGDDAFHFFKTWRHFEQGRGLEYCDYLHAQGRY